MLPANVFRVVCVISVLSVYGCVSANKKTNEAVDVSMYKPIEYENAAVSGPKVVVFPGKIKTRSALFMAKVGENNVRDFAELELSKANFQIIEHADKQQLFNEIAVAANLGDMQAIRAFKSKCTPDAKCFITFDVVKAEPVAWESRGGSGEAAGALVELGFLLANKGKENKLGKSINATLSSIKSYNYKTTWDVSLRYKIINASDGEIVCSNELSEQHVATSEMSSAVGVTNKDSTNFTIDAVVQRLVQKAVQDIDAQHKDKLISIDNTNFKSKGKVSGSNDKLISNGYAKQVEEHNANNDREMALDVVRAWMFAYSTIDPQSLFLLSTKTIQERIVKETGQFLKIPEINPNWRDKLTIDISKINYEIAEYTPDKCKVKVSGVLLFGLKGKEKEFPQTEIKELVREDGSWKVASLVVEKVKQ
jgi:hypothetical protein